MELAAAARLNQLHNSKSESGLILVENRQETVIGADMNMRNEGWCCLDFKWETWNEHILKLILWRTNNNLQMPFSGDPYQRYHMEQFCFGQKHLK